MTLQQNPLFSDLENEVLFNTNLQEEHPNRSGKTGVDPTNDGTPGLTIGGELQFDYLQIFPNPSVGLINLQASLIDNTPALRIQVLDLKGRVLYARTHRPMNGTQVRTQLNLSHLRAGTYNLVIEADMGVLTDRIVIE